MSESQIQQILKAMDNQDKVLASIREEQEKAKQEINDLKTKLEPIRQVFDDGSSFIQVSVYILKSLGLLGVGIGVLYGLVVWLRN
jgi:chromosome segregation ATPase